MQLPKLSFNLYNAIMTTINQALALFFLFSCYSFASSDLPFKAK